MINATYETLLDQATATADTYFIRAIAAIDKRLGEGYAKAHPELISAFMVTAGKDFTTAATIVAVQEFSSELCHALSDLAPKETLGEWP